MSRLLLLSVVAFASLLCGSPAWSADAAAPIDGARIYDQDCAKCHSSAFGAFFSGAPKTGDDKLWAQRLAAAGSVDALVASAIKGKGKMPPKGGAAQLDDAQMHAAVVHMLGNSGQ